MPPTPAMDCGTACHNDGLGEWLGRTHIPRHGARRAAIHRDAAKPGDGLRHCVPQ
ncbi:MAG: hypothetical protein P4L66_06245 [Acetobacteraceae bacterium]|nr:hypothetical protein [Acetobacteraceae bacterium]